MNNSMYYYSRDGVTVTVILDARRALANGNYPIKIRVTNRRQHVYYPTGKICRKKTGTDWVRRDYARC